MGLLLASESLFGGNRGMQTFHPRAKAWLCRVQMPVDRFIPRMPELFGGPTTANTVAESSHRVLA